VIFWIHLIATTILFSVNWYFGLIFLIALIVLSISDIILYLNYLWWPYHKFIDTSIVDIEKVEIPSTLEGVNLKAVVIRPKNSNPGEKHIGVLFHHGYTGFKEKVFRLAIPLVINGCVVLCPDARDHGETKNERFVKEDHLGIYADVEKEIDYLMNLADVDKDRIAMMGHSMGGSATLYAYPDERIKKLVEISAPFDLIGLFERHKTILTKGIRKRIIKVLKKSPDHEYSEELMIELSKQLSPKYRFEYEHSIPDKDRVYLVHCKQDNLVPFKEALLIKEALNLPDENTFFLEKPDKKFYMAAHNLTGQASLISAFCVKVALSLK